jgi:hypothetical protein
MRTRGQAPGAVRKPDAPGKGSGAPPPGVLDRATDVGLVDERAP